MKICVAGKNDIACNVLRKILNEKTLDIDVCVAINKDDTGVNTWQESLMFVAGNLGVKVLSLERLYEIKDLLFVSVEFDQIIKPQKFLSNRLYNIHFSLLPRHRGVSTAIWPILEGDSKAGVTFHEIDEGIDTGDIVEQYRFTIPEDYNSRDLYFRFMEEGEKLVIKNVFSMIASLDKPHAQPQTQSNASCHYRKDIDFQNTEKFIEWTASGVSRYLRAFNFHEYQLPLIQGLRVSNFRVTNQRGNKKAGELTQSNFHTYLLATKDFDVEIKIDPYCSLYDWCIGKCDLPKGFDFNEVFNINWCDENGWNPLMIAAYHGNLRAIKTLVKKGADINVTNKRGTSPLMYTRSAPSLKEGKECFVYLLSLGASWQSCDVKGKDIESYLQNDNQEELLNILNQHRSQTN